MTPTIRTHILGYPRMGAQRELKFALEAFWRGEARADELEAVARGLRATHWAHQMEAVLDFLTVGDFSLYDHVLDHIQLFGCEPARFRFSPTDTALARYFAMARGSQQAGCCGANGAALEMTKWFDTNYHYLVPEFLPDTTFRLASRRLFDEVAEARALGRPLKAVLLGPLTFLWLGKEKAAGFSRLDLLPRLLPVYDEVLAQLSALGVKWVQMDEPVLGLELPEAWRRAFEPAYAALTSSGVNLLIATYFSPLAENARLACQLPVAGLHLDLVSAGTDLVPVLDWLPAHKVLSLGIIDGRNVWRTDLDAASARLLPALRQRAEVWLAPSCSLLHVPLTLAGETGLDGELKSWLAFAREKLDELAQLANAARGKAVDWTAMRRALESRRISPRVHRPQVAERIAALGQEPGFRATPYGKRRAAQRARHPLPLLPTTTIGSFPQTREIRQARAALARGELDAGTYRGMMEREIARALRLQTALGLDVLVHGEPERNDMVEYFAEHLEGFAVTRNGWVQSYGSRCVKPPILYGDIHRPHAITVSWTRLAQGLTDKPVKGMLTGPVTLFKWSFVRTDLPLATVLLQLALAIRDEVRDLEEAGIDIIQIDEPALREGLPLRAPAQSGYLEAAARAFRLAAAQTRDSTQIHTHMCYAEFGDILPTLVELDADVLTIEASRSAMDSLAGFARIGYPNELGPGVFDVHSPQVPSTAAMAQLIEEAVAVFPAQRLWVNPDCGLKTRNWEEVEAALANMVAAAAQVRRRLGA